jgi:hypothetical protein
MLKFIQTIVFGSAALIAVIATAPLTPAAAQVPAGLLRLDSPRPTFNDDVRFTEAQQAKVRGAYASTRKNKRVR